MNQVTEGGCEGGGREGDEGARAGRGYLATEFPSKTQGDVDERMSSTIYWVQVKRSET